MEQFLKVLTEFEALGGTGIVYGGCLRDTLTGRGPIKDIDIACAKNLNNLYAIDRYVEMLREQQDGGKDLIFSAVQVVEQMIGYGNFPDVYKSVQVSAPDQPTVNFVILSEDFDFRKEVVAQRCDFGICQVALDKDSLYRTEAFDKDLRNYTFTYLREPFDQAQFDRSMRRWERFSERYEGWRMVVPEFGQGYLLPI
ncbi:hypothetical protein CYK37_30040 [Mesorhizobium loti]|nr:hypothetical protein [Mesorhizobium loti]PLP55533.1 hypothetical protein CYK37_30040 [Mesorhizobium loti]